MNSTELITDEPLRKQLESQARADAEVDRYQQPHTELSGTYQRQAVLGAANLVYALAYGRRAARIERMKGRAA